MRSVTLEITGMGCEGCANAVKGALERVDGVRRADVHLEEGTARVLADEGMEEDALAEAVERAGYGASARA